MQWVRSSGPKDAMLAQNLRCSKLLALGQLRTPAGQPWPLLWEQTSGILQWQEQLTFTGPLLLLALCWVIHMQFSDLTLVISLSYFQRWENWSLEIRQDTASERQGQSSTLNHSLCSLWKGAIYHHNVGMTTRNIQALPKHPASLHQDPWP